MQIPTELASQALQAINNAKIIAIGSHRNPDADTVGANLALRELLLALGKEVLSVCVDSPGPEVQFLKGVENYQKEFSVASIDLFICVDAGSEAQVAFFDRYPELRNTKILNIDHHASNNGYGTINLVYPDAASATFVLYYLFKAWNIALTPTMATSLLCGLYYDTGSFMHSNTTDEVYAVAGELIKLKADFSTISKKLFHNQDIKKLYLLGKILDSIKITDTGVAVSGLTEEEMNQFSANSKDVTGAIDYLSTIKDTEYATLLLEDGKGNIRGSFRTRHNHHNLSELASQFGGGGHKKASGFTMKGYLKKEETWSVEEAGN